MFISNYIFNKIVEKGEAIEKVQICEKEKVLCYSKKDTNENALELYRNVRDRISSKFGFDEFSELLPPSLPLIPCFDLSKDHNIRPWEIEMLNQYLRQPRVKQFEAVECTAGTYGESGNGLGGAQLWGNRGTDSLKTISAQEDGKTGLLPSPLLRDPVQKQYLNTGKLLLPCPKCGKETNFLSRGILTGEYEFYEYLCCGFFYYIQPYRKINEPLSSLVDMDGQRIFIISKCIKRRPKKFNHLLRAHLYMENQIIHELNLKVLDCGNKKNAEPVETDSNYAVKDTTTIVFGRYNNNPGHVIFEDLAGIIEFCELLKRNQIARKIRVYMARDFLWFRKLISLIPMEFLEKVVEFPGEIDSMVKFLNRSNINFDNLLMPEPWAKDRNTRISTQKILNGLADLSNGSLQARSDKNRSVILLHRFNNRKWGPVVENTIEYAKKIRRILPDIEIVIHGVFVTATEETRRLEETAGTSEGLRVLFNPELTVLLDEIANSSLCVGPIGSGFWWPSIFNKPCVTLHPRGDYSNIHAYNWIASPPKGVKPGFLYLLDHEKFICIEEERSIPRNVYDDLNVDVERVLESSLNLLK